MMSLSSTGSVSVFLVLLLLQGHVDAFPGNGVSLTRTVKTSTTLAARPVDNERKGRRNFLAHVAAAAFVPPAFASDCVCAAEVVDEIISNQEKLLIEDIKKEQNKEKEEGKDKGKLIAGLEKAKEQPAVSNPPSPPAKEEASAPPAKTAAKPADNSPSPTITAQKSQLAQASKLIDLETKDLIDQLEAEEEQIEEETMQLMRKVEALEVTAERLNKPLLPEPDAKTSDEAVAKSQKETMDFLERLKKRSKEKEDFINLLKAESKAFASGNKADMKLNEFLAGLKKSNDDDKQFGTALNDFREKLQARFAK